MAEDVIPHIAQRYSVSEAAARQIEKSLRSTGGRQAQFDHPDLGGHGQWMPGMIQIGKFNDAQLKVRVQGLAAEIAAIVGPGDGNVGRGSVVARRVNRGRLRLRVALRR